MGRNKTVDIDVDDLDQRIMNITNEIEALGDNAGYLSMKTMDGTGGFVDASPNHVAQSLMNLCGKAGSAASMLIAAQEVYDHATRDRNKS